MTRKIAAGCFAAMFALAVSASAQTPPAQPPSTPSPSPSSPASPYPSGQSSATSERGGTKITGCIQAGTAANSFELTNVKKTGAAAESTTPPPAGGAPASSSDKGTVKLVASPSVDLSTHVGHTVEVSGKWAAGGADAPASPSSAPSSSMGKEFQVSSVKMVSSTCSAGTN